MSVLLVLFTDKFANNKRSNTSIFVTSAFYFLHIITYILGIIPYNKMTFILVQEKVIDSIIFILISNELTMCDANLMFHENLVLISKFTLHQKLNSTH